MTSLSQSHAYILTSAIAPETILDSFCLLQVIFWYAAVVSDLLELVACVSANSHELDCQLSLLIYLQL